MFVIPEKDGVSLDDRCGSNISDVLYEYSKRAAAKQQNELDFFTEMLDRGFTISDFTMPCLKKNFSMHGTSWQNMV